MYHYGRRGQQVQECREAVFQSIQVLLISSKLNIQWQHQLCGPQEVQQVLTRL